MKRATFIALIYVLFSTTNITCAQSRLNDTLLIGTATIHGKLGSSLLGVQKLDSLEMQNNSQGNLAELLSLNSPVFIKTAAPGSLATISMRGTLASHTQVNWNGIRINSPMLGQVDFSLIPTFFTDQVQVFRGQASLQKGGGGLGGIIDLSSQGKWGDPFFGTVNASIGSFNTYRWMSDLGGGSGKFQTRLRLFRTQSQNDFSFLNTANGLSNRVKQQNADYILQGLLGQIFYRPNLNHLISMNVWMQMSDRNLPPIMSYEGSGREEYQLDEQIRLSGSWQYMNGIFGSKLSTGISYETMDYYLAHQTGGGVLINFNTHSQNQSIYNKYMASIDLNRVNQISINLHLDYHQVEINDEKLGSGYFANRLESGVQIKAQQTWNARLESYALLQQDWNRLKRKPINSSIGIAYQLIPNTLEMEFTGGKNFHLPTLNDLHWIPGGNPDLLPEEGYLADLGLKTMFSKDTSWSIEAELTGFVSYIDNWIQWTPGEFQYWSPENLHTVLARGFETMTRATSQLAHWKLQLRSNYAYTRTNQIGTIGKPSQLMYIPVHKASVLIHVERKSWYTSYNYTYTSQRYTSSQEEHSLHKLPAMSIHNISLGRRITLKGIKTDLRFQVNNLMNKDYQSILWRAMPGRYYTFNMKLEF